MLIVLLSEQTEPASLAANQNTDRARLLSTERLVKEPQTEHRLPGGQVPEHRRVLVEQRRSCVNGHDHADG